MRSKVISIRLNEEELKLLEKHTSDIGVKISDYIRATLKMVTDYNYYKSVREHKDRFYRQ